MNKSTQNFFLPEIVSESEFVTVHFFLFIEATITGHLVT